MHTKISSDEISILLTCTIDVCGIANMERSDTQIRLMDYQKALKRWLEDEWVKNIIVVENSGYPLDSLVEIAKDYQSVKNIEFLSFYGQEFPRHLGKGYGETLAIQHAAQNSKQLLNTGHFVKVNGRYYVPNINKVIGGMDNKTGVYFNITKSLSYSDSRVFAGNLDFLHLVCQHGLFIDDSKGIWFEHTLAKAGLQAIANGEKWQFINPLPIIQGISGTINSNYSEPAYKRYIKGCVNKITQYLLSL